MAAAAAKVTRSFGLSYSLLCAFFRGVKKWEEPGDGFDTFDFVIVWLCHARVDPARRLLGIRENSLEVWKNMRRHISRVMESGPDMNLDTGLRYRHSERLRKQRNRFLGLRRSLG